MIQDFHKYSCNVIFTLVVILGSVFCVVIGWPENNFFSPLKTMFNISNKCKGKGREWEE